MQFLLNCSDVLEHQSYNVIHEVFMLEAVPVHGDHQFLLALAVHLCLHSLLLQLLALPQPLWGMWPIAQQYHILALALACLATIGLALVSLITVSLVMISHLKVHEKYVTTLLL